MKAKKQLRKPENWQDFEHLCKKLWGEIWRCDEIKRNGRTGQNQHGVDVYGIPFGKRNYYGIQCKGKDDYTKSKLTKEEIDEEIFKALSFTPALESFYFTTTANKDAAIEAYVREKNLEHRKVGLFAVDLFSWEDIVDLIDENRETHEWYVNSVNYRQHYDIEVTFENRSDVYEGEVEYHDDMKTLRYPGDSPVNRSMFPFSLRLHNVGNSAIENPRLRFNIQGKFLDVAASADGMVPFKCDLEVDEETQDVTINVQKVSLGLDEDYKSWPIFLQPMREGSSLTLVWKFTSNQFKKAGELELNIATQHTR